MKIVISVGKKFDLSVPMLQELADRKGITLYRHEGVSGTVGLWTVDPKTQPPLKMDDVAFWCYLEKHAWCSENIKRNDPELVKFIEELKGGENSCQYENFHILDIPDDVDWEVSFVEGGSLQVFREYIVEKHRTWSV